MNLFLLHKRIAKLICLTVNPWMHTWSCLRTSSWKWRKRKIWDWTRRKRSKMNWIAIGLNWLQVICRIRMERKLLYVPYMTGMEKCWNWVIFCSACRNVHYRKIRFRYIRKRSRPMSVFKRERILPLSAKNWKMPIRKMSAMNMYTVCCRCRRLKPLRMSLIRCPSVPSLCRFGRLWASIS